MKRPWFVRLLLATRGAWVLLALLGGMALVMAYSVDTANWVLADRLIVTCVWLGLLFGWLLARTRFSALLAGFYTVDLAVLVILLGMANVFPLLLAGPGESDLLTSMNLRAFTFLQRVGGWYGALRGGRALEDTGLFLFLASLLAWLVTSWLAWSVIKKRNAYAGILPFAFVLGLNNDLSKQGAGMFWVFLMLALALMVYVTCIRNHRDWDARGVDYPDSLTVEWGFTTLGVTAIVSTLALMITTLGTPWGWDALSRAFRDMREKSEPAAHQLFGGVTPPKFDEAPLEVRTPDLSDFRSGLPGGDQTILWVKTSDPPPLPPEAGAAGQAQTPQHYWRANVFTVYTPDGWKPESSFDAGPPQFDAASPPPGRRLLEQEVEVLGEHDGALFAANQPVQVSQDVTLRYRTLDGTALLNGSASKYTARSWVTDVTANDLDAAAPELPQEIAAIYLQTPPDLPPRVSELAQRVTAGAGTRLEKTLRVQEYLRTTYAYSTAVQPAGDNADFVDHFLFEEQAGYCTHFASAMAVMLRTQGVAARVATGFATGSYDANRGAYRVTASAAHAWVEVFFPGYGWVEFEPTPARTTFAYPRYTSEGQLIAPTAPQPLPEPQAEPRRTWLVAVLLTALIALAAGALWLRRARRMQRAEGLAPAGSSGSLYWDMRDLLAWAGLRARPSVTPQEFLSRHADALGERDPLLRAAQDVTRLYLQAAFSRVPPAVEEVERARRAWKNARSDWLALLGQRVLVVLRRRKR